MTIYKQLIYGVAALLIGGAAFYFNQAGVPSLVASGQNDRRGSGVSAAEVFSGIYLCNETSGCTRPIKIILEDDTTLDIMTTNDEGMEISLGQGTWGVGAGGAIVMIIRNSDSPEVNYPSSLIASNVNSMVITGFSKKKALLPGMETPIFKRIKEAAPKVVQEESSL